MKTSVFKFMLTCIFVFFLFGSVFAQDEPGRKHRLEMSFSYEYLTPHDVYGTWKNFSIGLHNKPKPDLTYFVQLGVFSRKEGDGMLGNVGAYKDWGSRLYTYSALSIGTNSEYLPRIRIDNDFNIKIGAMKNIVWTAGVSYIKYFDLHKDLILSTGLTLYNGNWISGYRVSMNDSSPGNVISYSHHVSIGYGKEGWQWTFLDLSYGKQAYLATSVLIPEEVRQDAPYISIKHRRWIGKNFGVLIELNYLKLKDTYEKYGFSSGIFKEF